MTVLLLLIPISLALGLLGLGFCIWAVRNDQYQDPEGDAHRILDDRYDDQPAIAPPKTKSPQNHPPKSL